MAKQPVVAAAIVDSLVEPTQLLAAARSYPAHLAGKFELPGGKVEPGEDPLAALVREIREELGTKLTLGQMVAANDSPSPTVSPASAPTLTPAVFPRGAAWPILDGRIMGVWLAEVAEDAPAPRPLGSHSALRWVELAAASNLDWLPTNLPIVESLQREVAAKTKTRPDLA